MIPADNIWEQMSAWITIHGYYVQLTPMEGNEVLLLYQLIIVIM